LPCRDRVILNGGEGGVRDQIALGRLMQWTGMAKIPATCMIPATATSTALAPVVAIRMFSVVVKWLMVEKSRD
jgi:hypothetical protein